RVLSVDQVADELLGRKSDHDAQPVAVCSVQQGTWRHGVRNAHRIEAVGGHLRKIALDDGKIVVLPTVPITTERSLGDAPSPELRAVDVQKFPCSAGPARADA